MQKEIKSNENGMCPSKDECMTTVIPCAVKDKAGHK